MAFIPNKKIFNKYRYLGDKQGFRYASSYIRIDSALLDQEQYPEELSGDQKMNKKNVVKLGRSCWRT